MPKVTIDVEGRFIDHISDGALKAVLALKKLETAARKTGSGSSVQAFTSSPFLRSLNRNESLIKKLERPGGLPAEAGLPNAATAPREDLQMPHDQLRKAPAEISGAYNIGFRGSPRISWDTILGKPLEEWSAKAGSGLLASNAGDAGKIFGSKLLKGWQDALKSPAASSGRSSLAAPSLSERNVRESTSTYYKNALLGRQDSKLETLVSVLQEYDERFAPLESKRRSPYDTPTISARNSRYFSDITSARNQVGYDVNNGAAERIRFLQRATGLKNISYAIKEPAQPGLLSLVQHSDRIYSGNARGMSDSRLPVRNLQISNAPVNIPRTQFMAQAFAYPAQNFTPYGMGQKSYGSGHAQSILQVKPVFSLPQNIEDLGGKFSAKKMEIRPVVDVKPQVKQADFADKLKLDFKSGKTFQVDAAVRTNWRYDSFDDSWISPESRYDFSTDAQVNAGWKYNPFDGSLLTPEEKYAFTTSAQVDAGWTASPFDSSILAPEGGYAFTTDAQVAADWTASPFDSSLLVPKGGYAFTTDAQVAADWAASPFDSSILAPEGGYAFTTDAQVAADWTASPFDSSILAPESGYAFTTDAQVAANWTANPFDSSLIAPGGGYSFSTDAHVNANWSANRFDGALLAPQGGYAFSTGAHISANWMCNRFDAKQLAPESQYNFDTSVNIHAAYSVNKFLGNAQSDFGVMPSYSARTTVAINVAYSVNRGAMPNITAGIPKVSSVRRARGGIIGSNGPIGFAEGGMVRGGPQLVTVAEEGTPEMIIPLGSQRRQRGVQLWRKAGHMLGVEGFANGGIAGRLGRMAEPFARNNYAGMKPDPPRGTEPLQVTKPAYGSSLKTENSNVTVNVGGVTLQIDVSGTSGDIVSGVEQNKDKIADIITGVIRKAVSETFINSPALGGETA